MKEEHFIGKVATKAIIVKDGKVLMARDHKDDATWELPGGRINVGEDIEMGLKREIMEELGVAIKVGELVYSEHLAHAGENVPHLFIMCKASLLDESQPFKIPSEELAEIKWVDKDTIGELKMYDDSKRALDVYWADAS